MANPKDNQIRLTILLAADSPEGKFLDKLVKDAQSRPATVGRMILLEGIRTRMGKA